MVKVYDYSRASRRFRLIFLIFSHTSPRSLKIWPMKYYYYRGSILGNKTVPGLLCPKPFRSGSPRPGRFGPFFNPGLLGPLWWDHSAYFFGGDRGNCVILFIRSGESRKIAIKVKNKSKWRERVWAHAYRETNVDSSYMRIPNETSVC